MHESIEVNVTPSESVCELRRKAGFSAAQNPSTHTHWKPRKRTLDRLGTEVVKVDTFVGAVKSTSVQIKPGNQVRIEATYRRQAIRVRHSLLIA